MLLTPLVVFNSLVLIGLSHLLVRFCTTLMLFGGLIVSAGHVALGLLFIFNLIVT
jgi:hypothetical protein